MAEPPQNGIQAFDIEEPSRWRNDPPLTAQAREDQIHYWKDLIAITYVLGLLALVVTDWLGQLVSRENYGKVKHYFSLPPECNWFWILIFVLDFFMAVWMFRQRSIPKKEAAASAEDVDGESNHDQKLREDQWWRLHTIFAVAPPICSANLTLALWAHLMRGGIEVTKKWFFLDPVFLFIYVLFLNYAHHRSDQFKDDEDKQAMLFIRMPITIRYAWGVYSLVVSGNECAMMLVPDSVAVKAIAGAVGVATLVVWCLVVCNWRRSLFYGIVTGGILVALGVNARFAGSLMADRPADWSIVRLVVMCLGVGCIGIAMNIVAFKVPPKKASDNKAANFSRPGMVHPVARGS